MLNTLFVPTGTLVPGRDYWMGAIILIVLALLIQGAAYYAIISADGMSGIMMSSVFSMLLYLLIYPYFCLYAKRLRDSGNSPLWFILILVIYVIVNSIATMAVTMPAMFADGGFMAQQMDAMIEAQENGARPDVATLMEASMEGQAELMKKIQLPVMLIGIVVTLCFDFVMSRFKSKDMNNPYKQDQTFA